MKFHERFEILVDIEEARKRFVNRTYNEIFCRFFHSDIFSNNDRYYLSLTIATALGEYYYYNKPIEDYINRDFFRCLHALEAVFDYTQKKRIQNYILILNQHILRLLEISEVDLGVKWDNGKFIKSGVKLLDERLVNDPLKWLRAKGFNNVLAPYEKGLKHFLDSDKRPELRFDVITDMYEALEALAKIVTGKDKDLSGNRELFVKEVKSSDSYKDILKEYISYANNFRHAVELNEQKPKLSAGEVESFIYLTGIFIRLAMEGRS